MHERSAKTSDMPEQTGTLAKVTTIRIQTPPTTPLHAPTSPSYAPVPALTKDMTMFMLYKQEYIGVTYAPKYTRSQKRTLGCLCDTESEQNALLNNLPYTAPDMLSQEAKD